MIDPRKFLNTYRKFQYRCFNRPKYGLIETYSQCTIIGNLPESKFDCVHPCVRYTKKAFRGYHWWMVYTPYYNNNAFGENPILCYGIGDTEPPTEWHVYKEVVPQPEQGYNSDPNMLFSDDAMYIFWRENETPRLLQKGLHRGTFCIKITENEIISYDKSILRETLAFEDHEVSPTFIKFKGEYMALANHLLFKSPYIQKIPGKIKLLIEKVLLVTDLLGIYAQQKSYGIAVYGVGGGKSLVEFVFQYKKSVYPKYCNKLYRPWHSDAFEYDGSLYMIIQSNQCNADICIARWNEDFSILEMSKQPLVTNASLKKVGIYKPTAVVYADKLYVYTTAQDESNRNHNKLYLGVLPLADVKSLFR